MLLVDKLELFCTHRVAPEYCALKVYTIKLNGYVGKEICTRTAAVLSLKGGTPLLLYRAPFIFLQSPYKICSSVVKILTALYLYVKIISKVSLHTYTTFTNEVLLTLLEIIGVCSRNNS